MKSKIFLSAFLSLAFNLLSSQVPQGFNYQAIARDGSGNPITNATIKVKLSILSDTTGFYVSGTGTYIWEEEQTNVKTNAFGLFTVVFGNTSATKIQGSAASFSAIDWAKTPLFIGTKIANPTTYKNLGTAKLYSVPYSMVTDSTKALLKGSKLSVVSSNDFGTDALFEVKRKDGQTVFAVYPDAVNIYVPRTAKGATKGGFAIGGFDQVKLGTQDYFRVTSDSVRIYIDKTPTIVKGATKGGFAIGGFDQVKGNVQDLLTVSNDSVRIYIDKTPVIKGATKGGFAIGGFDQVKGGTQDLLTVSNDSIRMYINDISGKGATKGGFAIGGFDQVKGARANFLNVATDATGIINPSQNRILWYPIKNAFLAGKVFIEKPDSVGVNSFATGYESKAKGQYSQALGFQAIARGDYSTAIGKNAVASKINSFAFGEGAFAGNNESYAIGREAVAAGYRSFAFGSAGIDTAGNPTDVTRALGDYSFAIGQGSLAYGKGSFSLGLADTAMGDFSIALGYKTCAKLRSTAIGDNSSATGFWSTALGSRSSAKGFWSTAMGYNSTAIGTNSTAIGISTKAIGDWSTALGYGTIASGSTSTAIGSGSEAGGSFSTAMGLGSKASGNYSTTMGFYTNAIGLGSTAMGYSNTASGDYSIAMGRGTNATMVNSTAMGYTTTASGFRSTAMGSLTIASGSSSTAMGQATTANGEYSTSLGYTTTASGWYSTAMGFSTIANGYSSTAMGLVTKAIGNNSTSMGSGTKAIGDNATSLGYSTKAKPYASLVIGEFNDSTCNSINTWVTTDPLFIAGNGSSLSTSNALTLYKNGNLTIAGTLTQSSDFRLKENILSISNGTEFIEKINPVYFYFKDKNTHPDGRQIGFIAQEVREVLPELVQEDGQGYLSVDYSKMSVVLLQAFKEQQKQIEGLQQQIESTKQENLQLKSQLQILQDKVEQIEGLLSKGGLK